MWIALNDAFLSVVEPRPVDVPASERKRFGRGWRDGLLMVRARKRVHLTRHFPTSPVHQWKGRDYPFRVFVTRAEAADIIGRAVAGISYGNFKSSVRDNELHDAYMGVWTTMHRYQHGGFARRAAVSWRDDEFWSRGAALSEVPDYDDEPCATPGCTDMNPCMDCVVDALRADRQGLDGPGMAALQEEADANGWEADDRDLAGDPDLGPDTVAEEATRYGPYDDGEGEGDEDAGSHLRVPPK